MQTQGDGASGHPRHRRGEARPDARAQSDCGWTIRKYQEIIADYNREKDRATIEETFRRLVELVNSLDEEQKRAATEGLSEDELALFDLLQKDGLDKTDRERVKQASRELLASIKARLAELDRFWEKEQTKADVEVFILDEVFANLPTPPFTPDEKKLSRTMSMPTSGSKPSAADFATSV